MADNMGFEYLFLSEQDYAEEVTEEITTSLVSMMRPSKFESSEEGENADDLRNESEAGKSNDAPILSKIEAFSNAHASKVGLKKKNNTNSSYNANHIGRFLLLVTEKFSIKTAVVDAIINLSSAYQFKNQWEEEGTLLQ
ncbi:hypothetical protein G6F46_002789 [Rhizopus delemar]|uniref:Uncharacterized protein n=2 Tax=Rhizopus TaxID=4842 RepID=A0A9P7CT35_9FUNG|nr:hypothetical protein G6F36_000904 [Rhizopus arrhizus]KAG1463345.1 hypothetical protein G6F55_002444 [Rhizopus delemar]KAG1502599.1 hypothetical protein G6F54_002254 [Rhizopus delemar]KAG1516959.1 hypothetical protein G6F53_001751 [Rhizopus delemar]KAG1551225.1 hypothetical protein G6F51_001984 [Rhizopus arrhizus]